MRRFKKPKYPYRPSKKEFNEVLRFLLEHGIISHQEYTEIQTKALPFLR